MQCQDTVLITIDHTKGGAALFGGRVRYQCTALLTSWPALPGRWSAVGVDKDQKSILAENYECKMMTSGAGANTHHPKGVGHLAHRRCCGHGIASEHSRHADQPDHDQAAHKVAEVREHKVLDQLAKRDLQRQVWVKVRLVTSHTGYKNKCRDVTTEISMIQVYFHTGDPFPPMIWALSMLPGELPAHLFLQQRSSHDGRVAGEQVGAAENDHEEAHGEHH